MKLLSFWVILYYVKYVEFINFILKWENILNFQFLYRVKKDKLLNFEN